MCKSTIIPSKQMLHLVRCTLRNARAGDYWILSLTLTRLKVHYVVFGGSNSSQKVFVCLFVCLAPNLN